MERFAKQLHNQALHRQAEDLHPKAEPILEVSHQACQAEPVLEVSHQACQAEPVLEVSHQACQAEPGAENPRGEASPSDRRQPRPLHQHFRQRSASDVAALRLRESQSTRFYSDAENFRDRFLEFGRTGGKQKQVKKQAPREQEMTQLEEKNPPVSEQCEAG